MWAHGLPTLSYLLLTAQLLLLLPPDYSEGSQKLWPAPALGSKPQIVQRTLHHQYPISSTFATPDKEKCHLTIKEQGKGVTLLNIQCTHLNNVFTCVFAGNPKSCTANFAKNRIYWKQLGDNLRSQKNLCEDDSMVLTTRICSSQFPESNLRLVKSFQVTKASEDKLGYKFQWQASKEEVFHKDSGSTGNILDNQDDQESLVNPHFSLELSESDTNSTEPDRGPEQILLEENMISTNNPSNRIEMPQLTDMNMDKEMVPQIYQDSPLQSYLGPEQVGQEYPMQSYDLGPQQVNQDYPLQSYLDPEQVGQEYPMQSYDLGPQQVNQDSLMQSYLDPEQVGQEYPMQNYYHSK